MYWGNSKNKFKIFYIFVEFILLTSIIDYLGQVYTMKWNFFWKACGHWKEQLRRTFHYTAFSDLIYISKQLSNRHYQNI